MNKSELKKLAGIISAIADGAEWECWWESGEDEDGNPIPGYGPPLGRDVEYCIANRIEIRLKDPQENPPVIDDGGPVASGMEVHTQGESQRLTPIGGMSLRDWLASQEMISPEEGFSWELCEALAGKRPEKDRKTDPIGWEIWQAVWQAKIKFIRADAMLAARKEASK